MFFVVSCWGLIPSKVPGKVIKLKIDEVRPYLDEDALAVLQTTSKYLFVRNILLRVLYIIILNQVYLMPFNPYIFVDMCSYIYFKLKAILWDYIEKKVISQNEQLSINIYGGRRGRDCMLFGFITTYVISAYHN
jgi:hypothetical protein